MSGSSIKNFKKAKIKKQMKDKQASKVIADALLDMKNMTEESFSDVSGHVPCTVPAAVPCVEAAVNIALLSHMIDYPNFC